ncbi:MAG TPA: thioredoxin family protein [Planctomycetota bacterium]|jgi:small redox-active disulfide protein 2|nr:thioredoxin family protein [Planctomycetota bacterium]
MKIEILGTGCSKCKVLAQSAKDAVAQLGLEAEIVKVEKIEDIMSYGVMMTPALVVDGVVKSSGKALTATEVANLIA